MKISHKGILLISLPLVCEVIFVAILFHLQDGLEAAATRESRSREIISIANSILLHVNELAANGALFGLLTNPDAQVKQLEDIRHEMARERDLMSYCPEQSRNWKLLSDHAQLASQTLLDFRDAMQQGEHELTAETRRNLRIMLGRLFLDLQRIKDEEERRHQSAKHDTEAAARRRVKFALWSGVAGNTVLTALFLAIFYKQIGAKLSVITSTVKQIAEQKKLSDPLPGSDELSELDAVLHQMHESLQSARRKDRALLDNATALICSLDENMKFVEVSKAAEEILGLTREELTGLSLERLIDPEQVHLIATLQRGDDVVQQPSELELKLIRPDGTPAFFHWSICWSPMDRRFFCVALDISQQKELEQMKRDFMNMVSHDLRTPLTALIIFLEMLSSGGFGPVNATAATGLDKSRRSLNRLIELVNGLLDLEKIDSGRLTLSLKSSSLLGVLAEAIEMVDPLCEANEIELVVNVDPEIKVMADQSRLLQVVQNLLSNAIKYSPVGATITVLAETTADLALVKVIDQGPGIPFEMQKTVFERFKQLDTAAKKGIKGTGIGLSVCKSLIELHGGEIGVKSASNGGAEFWFTLALCASGTGRENIPLSVEATT